MFGEPVIDLRRLRVLREVERRGTVSAAAAALHLTPSAVSQQIAGLSRDLGVPLLAKHGRGVQLTGQAHLLLEHAAVVTEQLDRARADLAAWSEGATGRVRIGALSTGISSIVGPSLARLRETHPELELLVREVEAPEAFELLDGGELDLVLAVDYRDSPARTDPRYTRVDLITDPMDIVLPVGHQLATETAWREGLKLERLAEEAWVSSAPDDPCAMITAAVCAAAGFSPDIRHECLEWDATAALVAAGAGVALIPRLAWPLRPAGLVTIPVVGSPASRLIFALARAGDHTSPPAMAVLETLVQVATERPDAAERYPHAERARSEAARN